MQVVRFGLAPIPREEGKQSSRLKNPGESYSYIFDEEEGSFKIRNPRDLSL